MEIKSNLLPRELVELIQTKSFHRDVGSWQLKSDIDSFGNPLETELGQLFETEAEITKATNRLPCDFKLDGDYGEESESDYPGCIPDIVDFTEIVCFGMSGDGAPFCLDFRELKCEPAVMWWDDIYWRKISPSFKEFLALLEVSC